MGTKQSRAKRQHQQNEKNKQSEQTINQEMLGINLGRCWNKYLIIDIFLFSGEDDPQKETEIVLWACSKRHRVFLTKNHDWYTKKIERLHFRICL